MMDAGVRDKLVTIELGTEMASASGLPLLEWATMPAAQGGRQWMHKRDASGSERLSAAQFQADVESEWEMPYQANMDPDLVDVPKYRRLSYSGRVYNIRRAWVLQRHEGRAIRLVTLTTSKR